MRNFTGRIFLGLRQANEDSIDMPFDNDYPPPNIKASQLVSITTNYTILAYMSSCLFYYENTNTWLTDGCTVSKMLTKVSSL